MAVSRQINLNQHRKTSLRSLCSWCKRRRSRLRVERARSLVFREDTTCGSSVVLFVLWVDGLPLSTLSTVKLLRSSRWYVPEIVVDRNSAETWF